MKIVIERDKWLRGDPDESALRRHTDRKMCCLGFRCLALGLSKAAIFGHYMPEEVARLLPKRDWMINKSGGDSRAAKVAASINDKAVGAKYKRKPMTEKRREQLLKELFKKHGDTIVFK